MNIERFPVSVDDAATCVKTRDASVFAYERNREEEPPAGWSLAYGLHRTATLDLIAKMVREIGGVACDGENPADLESSFRLIFFMAVVYMDRVCSRDRVSGEAEVRRIGLVCLYAASIYAVNRQLIAFLEDKFDQSLGAGLALVYAAMDHVQYVPTLADLIPLYQECLLSVHTPAAAQRFVRNTNRWASMGKEPYNFFLAHNIYSRRSFALDDLYRIFSGSSAENPDTEVMSGYMGQIVDRWKSVVFGTILDWELAQMDPNAAVIASIEGFRLAHGVESCIPLLGFVIPDYLDVAGAPGKAQTFDRAVQLYRKKLTECLAGTTGDGAGEPGKNT